MTGNTTRVIVNGPLVGEERTGPAVHLVELVRAMMAQRPELLITARHSSIRGSAANDLSAARISSHVRPVTTPIPNTALRAMQASIRFPSERVLLGEYDIYHQFHTDADPAVPDRKLVVTLHDTVALDWPDEEGQMYARAGRLLRRAAAVITVSQFSKTAICEAFDVDPSHVTVVSNGVDQARFRPRDDRAQQPTDVVSGSDPYLLFVGGHTPRKNVPRLIDAFARVREALGREDLTLALAGPVASAEQELRRCAPATLPSSALKFLGYVPDNQVVDLYRDAEVLMCTSLYEGFGLPALEAMACGTPVVASDGSALREVAGAAAVLVNPLDAASIADGAVQVLTEPEAQRADRRARGIEHATHFTWDRAARAVLSIYDRIAGS